MSKKFLVIGYGNNLRSDDGAGKKVVEIVSQWNLDHVKSIAVHQLTPELSDAISQADIVIFIDAVLTPSPQFQKLQLHQLEATAKITNLGHHSDPSQLLSFTQAIYGKFPTAYWILIPAINFEFGENFSPVTHKGMTLAIAKIRELIFF